MTETVPGTGSGAGAAARGGRPAWPGTSAVAGPVGPFLRPLADTDFVVVDLETTGGSPEHAAIMEIGAVRIRGGPPTGSQAGSPAAEPVFSTLVNPGRPVPEHICALTGITDALVAGAPRIGAVLPAFLEFAAGAVMVAHNAPFDLGFLTAACESEGVAWPAVPVLDTAGLARRVLTTAEAPDCRLGTLARVLRTAVPDHRALDDARATAAVLRELIGRLAGLGVRTLDGIREITGEDAGCPPGPGRERMFRLTADIPSAPGVCLFLGAGGEVLHVVKSSDMRARVRGYFAVSETRRHIHELLDDTRRLCPVTRPTALAADVEEIRVIARHRPRYNEDQPPAAAPPAPAAPPAAAGHDAPPVPAPEVARLARARRVLAARPRFDGGWDVAVIKDGLLAASAALPPGTAPETGVPAEAGIPVDGPAAERMCVLHWLSSPGVRLIEVNW